MQKIIQNRTGGFRQLRIRYAPFATADFTHDLTIHRDGNRFFNSCDVGGTVAKFQAMNFINSRASAKPIHGEVSLTILQYGRTNIRGGGSR